MSTTPGLQCFKCDSSCTFKDVTKSREIKDLFGCPCDLCKRVLCRTCSQLSSSEIRALTAQTRVISYFCPDCLKSVQNNIMEIPNIQNQVVELSTNATELKEKFEIEVNKLKSEMKEIKSTYAEVVSKNDLAKQIESTKSVKDELKRLQEEVIRIEPIKKDPTNETVLHELEERQARSKNILIFGLPESSIENREDRQKEEKIKIISVLQLCKDSCNEELQFYRLGKFVKNKVRPVKVELKTAALALEIIRNKNKLPKDLQTYIKPDLTFQQREYHRKVVLELKGRVEKGEQNLKIGYSDRIPKIVKMRSGVAKN